MHEKAVIKNEKEWTYRTLVFTGNSMLSHILFGRSLFESFMLITSERLIFLGENSAASRNLNQILEREGIRQHSSGLSRQSAVAVFSGE